MTERIRKLILKLDTSSDRSAEATIAQLVQMGLPAVKELRNAAADLSRSRVRKWSLEALGNIGHKSAAPLLVKALRDPSMSIRLHAVRGLARMKYKLAAPHIRKLLRDPSGGIRVNAIDALIKLKDQASSAALIRALSDEKWYVRQHAARACGEIKVKTSVPRLRRLQKPESGLNGDSEGTSGIITLSGTTLRILSPHRWGFS